MSESSNNKDSESERIAVVGMAWVDAEYPDLASFWNSLIECPQRQLFIDRLLTSTGSTEKTVLNAIADARLDGDSSERKKIEVFAVEDYPQPSTSNALKKAILGLMDMSSDAVVVSSRVGQDGSAALVLMRFSDAMAKGDRIYACFGSELTYELNQVDSSGPLEEGDLNQTTEDCIYFTCESDRGGSAFSDVIKSVLALYHRILPPGVSVGHISPTEHAVNYRELFFNSQTRPWIHPSAHPELVAIKPEIADSHRPRQAFVAEKPATNAYLPLVLEEALDDYFTIHPTLHTSCETELFAFEGDNSADLMAAIREFRSCLNSGTEFSLKDIAYSLNCNEDSVDENRDSQKVRLAIVAGTIKDLTERAELAIECLQEGIPPGYEGSLADQGVYFGGNNEKLQSGKLAFLLPGLGSAYPNMLSELCVYFPEVRVIFDFVDYLAQDAGSAELPSDKIFPKPTSSVANPGGNATADLVAMDAAVVTVLLAEWALFTLLLKLEILPDVLVGCSTGEFAALSMGGAANILTSSPMFYRLSTDVANSLPKERLAELRSIKVKAPLESFTGQLQKYDNKVFLSADLSDEQVILTGDKGSIARLESALEKSGVEVDYLPVAIPYHTALVAGVVSTDHEEVESVEMQAPEIPSWSCSIASEYPSDPEAIKRITTELFSQPIRFKTTIKRLYEDAGVTKFVEVGPKDILTPIVTEILSSRPHVAVSSNKASGSAVSHLNHALAQLYCCGVSMNLEYLYSRRMPKRIDLRAIVDQAITIMPVEAEQPAIEFQYPEQSEAGYCEGVNAKAHGVVETYLAELAEVHRSMMSAQQAIMAAYLNCKGEESSIQSEQLAKHFPLLNGCSIVREGHVFQIDVPLNLEWHRYLLDHAIGGAVRTEGSEKVCLLPLTVALEMMAEVAACLYPQLKVVELQEIRAYKRIRVGAEGFVVRISATPRSGDDAIVEVAMQKPNLEAGNDVEGETLMSCFVLLASSDPDRPPDASPHNTAWNKSKFVNRPLYGKDAMFHGPRMQSVKSVGGVSASRIYGALDVREASDWFPTGAGEPNFLLDPLLLDNSTQLVLYHLFERDERVDALLPFMIDSLRVFGQGVPNCAEANVWVEMNSVTTRGTDADVYVTADHGELIAKFESIKSRRIVLKDDWHMFVHAPSDSFISLPAVGMVGSLVDRSDRIYRYIDESTLPDEEAALIWCSDYILSPREVRVFERLSNSRRKREWLLGRIAAKDAIRLLVSGLTGLRLSCGDIEIASDQFGAPTAVVPQFSLPGSKLTVSITHKDGLAIAVAGYSANRIGIDLEKIEAREVGLEKLLFSEGEQALLNKWIESNRDLNLSIAWAAKEAAAKAIGAGLKGDPKSLEIVAVDAVGARQRISLRLRGSQSSNMIVFAQATETYVLTECELATAAMA